MRSFKTIMVTGGAGFIGGNFIRHVLNKKEFSGRIINVDTLTYAGNPLSLRDVEEAHGTKRYIFQRADIRERDAIDKIMAEYDVDCIVHFAAESHVDRSIYGPGDFVTTNINGTFTLLESARAHWSSKEGTLFHHVSTDEVYGSLGDNGYFFEDTPYDPKSPYSASKAASDHLVRAWNHTYGLPVTLSNCSNNYGPYHFPEKLIPLIIKNILEGKKLPVYGDGSNVRDWLYVEDHCKAIDMVVRKGDAGEIYNVGGHNEMKNIDIVKLTINTIRQMMIERPEYRKVLKKKEYDDDGQIKIDWINEDLITFVKDRLGHDHRYAIDPSKIKADLGWQPETMFAEGIVKTIEWYLNNQDWVNQVTSGDYQTYYERMYSGR